MRLRLNKLPCQMLYSFKACNDAYIVRLVISVMYVWLTLSSLDSGGFPSRNYNEINSLMRLDKNNLK